jgi:phospholipase C
MKSGVAAAAVTGLLASSALASPTSAHFGWPGSGSANTQTSAPFGYKAGSQQSISNLKSKIKNVVWILLENRSFDNILGGVRGRGLDNPTNNGDYCIPQNLSQPNGQQWCTSLKDFDSVLNDPDHSVTGNNFEFFGQFSPNNAAIANGSLKETQQGFVQKQLISYPDITAETAAKQVMGYYSEDEIPVLLNLVDEFVTFNSWFSCIPGVSCLPPPP